MPLRGHHCGWIVIAVVAVAFGVLNYLTPEYHDDFVYKFVFEGGAVNYDHPVRSVGDIIQSQICHYQAVNGRSVVHFLVQLFTGLLGKPVFNILNVIVFCGFLLLLQKRLWRDARLCVSTVLTLVLVLLMPRFKDTFLWMTGSINYLWSAVAALVFLLFYEKRRERMIDISLAPMLIATFLLGWTHEGITLPLGAALVIINLFSLKDSHGRKQGLWLALSFLAGGCMITLAPGTIARSGMGGGLSPSTLGLKVITGLTVLGKLRLVYLALFATALVWFYKREIVKKALKRDGFLLLAALLACGIVFVSGLDSTRTAFGLELFSLIYLLRLLGDLLPLLSHAVVKWCGIGLTLGLLLFYGLLLSHTIPSWQESQRLIAQIERTDDGIIGTNEHHAGLFSSFICTMLSPDSTVNAVNYNPKGWPASIAATYGRDSLVFLPQAFLDDLKARPERHETLEKDTPFEFFVQRIADDGEIKEVSFELEPNDFADVNFIFRPIARKMSRYTDTTVTTDKWAAVNLYGKRYLIIKRDRELDRRLRDVRVKMVE